MLMLTDWFEEMIRNWLQLVCTSFRIKWVKLITLYADINI